jgi:hypothetical protein
MEEESLAMEDEKMYDVVWLASSGAVGYNLDAL